MLKISIKSLIDASMRLGRTLTDDHPQLQQFLILMEHTLKHRMKSTQDQDSDLVLDIEAVFHTKGGEGECSLPQEDPPRRSSKLIR